MSISKKSVIAASTISAISIVALFLVGGFSIFVVPKSLTESCTASIIRESGTGKKNTTKKIFLLSFIKGSGEMTISCKSFTYVKYYYGPELILVNGSRVL